MPIFSIDRYGGKRLFMKLRCLLLALLLLISSVVVAGIGVYVKYGIILPRGLDTYGQKSVIELPFLYLYDPVLQYLLANEPVQTEPPVTTQTPPTTVTTAPPVTTQGEIPLPVGEEWFDDALFIGDSRTVGLRDYARSGDADYFCEVGMTVFDVESKSLEDRNFPKQSLVQLLETKSYGKIFINFGLNEAGYPQEAFYKRYESFVELIRTLQPQAVLILQGIMSVTTQKAEKADYFHPAQLQKRNDWIASLADGQQIFYIDVNTSFADEAGFLLEELTNDGYHPTASGYCRWRDWITEAVSLLPLS